MKKILMTAFGGIPQKAVIILILIVTLQLSKAQTASIKITKKNSAGTITRQIDSSGFSSIWNFTNTSTGWISTINYLTPPPCPGVPIVYYAGQTYHTVQIGSQCWLMENLNVGTMINGMQEQTNNGIIEKYCFKDDSANCTTYGGLYQWAEAVKYKNGATDTSSPNPAFSGNIQGICPGGWHIPTDNEFDTLAKEVNQDGNALKAIGQDGTSTNTSGFSVMLAGSRGDDGYFYDLGYYTYFWSSTEGSTMGAYTLDLYGSESYVNLGYYHKGPGFGIRCVKD
ncbi:MAG: FISUMP domain-containing protein [Ignavibacteriaceae bacterium]